MTFPGAGAQVYYNEAGEPLGWDYPSYDGRDFEDSERDWEEEEYWRNGGDDEPGTEWVICDECGNEYEDGDPEAAKHEADTGHKRWI